MRKNPLFIYILLFILLLTALVCSFSHCLIPTEHRSIEQILSLNELKMYTGNSISGNQVYSAISYYKNKPVHIIVDNGYEVVIYGPQNDDLTEYTYGNLSAAKDIANLRTVYIAPYDVYTGIIIDDHTLQYTKN